MQYPCQNIYLIIFQPVIKNRPNCTTSQVSDIDTQVSENEHLKPTIPSPSTHPGQPQSLRDSRTSVLHRQKSTKDHRTQSVKFSSAQRAQQNDQHVRRNTRAKTSAKPSSAKHLPQCTHPAPIINHGIRYNFDPAPIKRRVRRCRQQIRPSKTPKSP